MCGSIGGDYCVYVSAGRVANADGFAAVYNLDLLKQAESLILQLPPGPSGVAVPPFLYLPVFVVPFQVFALVQPGIGYWIWTVANVALLLLYLRFFLRRMQLPPAPARLVAMLFISLPLFMNVFTGQIDVWLAVCVGEFMRAMVDRRPYRAGLWLGGLVLKPQILLLITAVLLVQRAWRLLAGVASCGAVLSFISLLLVGPSGFLGMLSGWLTTVGGTANIWVDGMMNWRMLGFHLANISNSWIGWGFTGAGMLATLVIMLFVWRRPLDPDSPSFAVATVGMLAAAAMLAWHAHIHLAVMLIPPLVYAYQRNLLPQRIWDYWVFLPAVLYMAMVFIPESLIALGVPSAAVTPVIYFVIGAGEFSANLVLFCWAVRTSTQRPGALPNVALGGSPSH